MEEQNASLTGMGLRRTGRASGCSCCGFTLLGFLAVPLAALAAIFFVL